MRPRHLALMLLVCLIWASNNVMSKLIVGTLHVPPLFFTALRFAIVALVTLPWLLPMPRPRWRLLLIGLLKSDEGSGGFVFIDEPFAHLDIRNIQLVGEFLKNTDAQYLMTTPLTHNTDVYDPSELTLITSKKKKDQQWAQPIFVLQRRKEDAKAA